MSISNSLSINPGSAGEVLISNGASSPPSFGPSPSNSGWVLIQSQSASSSSSIDFTTNITSTYYNYVLVYDNVSCGIAEDYMSLVFSSDGGMNWFNSNYSSATGTGSFDSLSGSASSSSTTELVFATVNSDGAIAGTLFLYNLTNGSPATAYGLGVSSFFATIMGGGYYSNGATVINAIRIAFDSSLIPAGNFHLYGISQ